MLHIGLVSIDIDRKWIGGRYYLQHLVRAVRSLPVENQIAISDVWWQESSPDDPFAEVRELLDGHVVVAPPRSVVARLRRKIRRLSRQWRDSRDLFIDAGIDAVFPIAPCADPGVPLI